MPGYAILTGCPITIDKPEILNRIWVESLETINKAMQFVFPSPMTMVKSRSYFFKISLPLRYGEMSPKCEF